MEGWGDNEFGFQPSNMHKFQMLMLRKMQITLQEKYNIYVTMVELLCSM